MYPPDYYFCCTVAGEAAAAVAAASAGFCGCSAGSLSFGGGADPGKAVLCPGMEYCGLNWAKFTPKTPESWPCLNPSGNWAAPWASALAAALAPAPPVANRDRMERSDICNLWATGGIRAKDAGSRETSDFMSDSNSSN